MQDSTFEIQLGPYLNYKTSHTPRARKLRRKMTPAERKIWTELLRKDTLFGYRFLRQKPIDNYIADFYCSALLLVVEIDGKHHLAEKTKKYDEARTKVLNEYGIEVIRFSNEQVLNHFADVEALLREVVLRRSSNPP